jgi:hypothetical protein
MIYIGIILLATALLLWWPRYRLHQAIARPFASPHSKILRKNLPVYAGMPVPLQLQLKRLTKQFLHEKKFIGCDGFEITDEVRVTIAAKACLLLLNRRMPVFPDLSMVLVYPAAFVVPRTEFGVGGVVTHQNQTLSGESWSDGRVILAWDHILNDIDRHGSGHDVVIHEFAHQLDSASGRTNGAPALPSKARYARWAAVFEPEFAALQAAVERHQHGKHAAHTGQHASHQQHQAHETVLDFYGATSPAEFFAVATEAFFGNPAALAQHHAALFAELRGYYQVDPRNWM